MTKSSRTSGMRVRIGILGAGYISQTHLRALQAVPEVEVTSVCDVRRAKAASLASQWNIPKVFDRLEEMADSGVDVVHVLLPPALHADAAIACLRGGRDVFLEKPMGVTAEECRAIAAAAGRHGLRVGVNHNFTFHPAFLRLLEAIRGCYLGGLEHVIACVNVPLRQLTAGQHGHWMFQSPGNIILEQAPHPLSQIQYLLGPADTVSTLVSGETTLTTGRRFYRNWQVSLRCALGTAQCYLSFGAEYFDFWLYVIGQDGSALVDLRRETVLFGEKTRFVEPVDHVRYALRQGASEALQGSRNFLKYLAGFLKLKPLSDPFSISFSNSIGAFYHARMLGVPVPVSAEHGLSVIETCEKIVRGAG